MNNLFDNRYRLIDRLGQGSYGVVYSAADTLSNKTVVLKIAIWSLAREAEAFQVLHRHWSPTGIPKMLSYVNNSKEYIVMEKLGKSLRYFWKLCGNKFSLKTVVMLGTQMISRLECIHNRGIVHGDVKDDNFVMDEQYHTLYIIDFGLSRPYVDNCTGTHVTEEVDKHVLGTVLYASINTHKQIKLSRRDDIESLAYLLIRLLKRSLPWENPRRRWRTFEETFENAGIKKMKTGINELCTGIPEHIKEILVYARRLGFAERPDYAYLLELLRRAFLEGCYSNDGVYDWMINESGADSV